MFLVFHIFVLVSRNGKFYSHVDIIALFDLNVQETNVGTVKRHTNCQTMIKSHYCYLSIKITTLKTNILLIKGYNLIIDLEMYTSHLEFNEVL